jgi:hypothetical protein
VRKTAELPNLGAAMMLNQAAAAIWVKHNLAGIRL